VRLALTLKIQHSLLDILVGLHHLNLATNRVIISRHVIFDETTFPFSRHRTSTPHELDFLTNNELLAPSSSAGTTSGAPAQFPLQAAPEVSEDAPVPLWPPVLARPAPRRPPPGFHTPPAARPAQVLPQAAAPVPAAAPAPAAPAPAAPPVLPMAEALPRPPVTHAPPHARTAAARGDSPSRDSASASAAACVAKTGFKASRMHPVWPRA